jgi:hypothetical protein
MQQRGWVESRDFTLDLRVTEGISERAEALASELVRLKVDLVLTIAGEVLNSLISTARIARIC